MTYPFLRTALLAALLVHLPAAALSISPVVLIPRCPAALMDMPQAQLVERLVAQPQPQPFCSPMLDTLLTEQALPFLIPLMDHQRHSVQLAAVHAIDRMDARASAAVPVLMARHWRTIAALARQSAAPGPWADHEHALAMMAHLSSALGGLQDADPGVTPYLTAVFFDRGNTPAVRLASVAAFWDAARTSDATRLRIVPELLADTTAYAAMQGRLASFLASSGDAGFALPAVRARLLVDHDETMVAPFLAVQGAQLAIPRLLQLHAGAAPGSPMRSEIARVLHERRALPEVDEQFGMAAGDPALFPTVLELINSGIESQKTFAYLAGQLDKPSEADSIARTLIAIGRPAPQTHPRLLAMLQSTGADDVERRDLLITALVATAGQARIPAQLLVDGMVHDVALERRSSAYALRAEPCVPSRVLAQAAPLAPSFWPVLKRTYGAALRPARSRCLEAVVAVMAKTEDPKTLGFLYNQLLSASSPALREALLPALTTHVGPLLPRIRRDIDRLRGERLMVVEQLLRGPQASQFLAQYRARVLPGLLTLPWTGAAGQGGPWLDRIDPARERSACEDLARAVSRVDTIGPATPEATTWLMRVHAGPCTLASQQAWDALEMLKRKEPGKRPLRVSEVNALFAATPPGRAQQRLEELRELFEWTYSEKIMPGISSDSDAEKK